MLNKFTGIGNLTQKPEIKDIGSEYKVCKFSIAINNAIRKDVLFLDIECWGKVAINCHKFLDKGSAIAVDGRLEAKKWQDKQGQNRTKIFCVADNIHFLKSSKDERAQPPPKTKAENTHLDYEEDEDEVPF
jgi:single-strand DNA-binding protein